MIWARLAVWTIAFVAIVISWYLLILTDSRDWIYWEVVDPLIFSAMWNIMIVIGAFVVDRILIIVSEIGKGDRS